MNQNDKKNIEIIGTEKENQKGIMRNSFIFRLSIVCLSLVSCDTKRVYDEYKSVSNLWNKDSIITFKVNPPDSLNPYNVFINLRNTNDYKYNNLYIIVSTKFPKGKIIKDTLEYQMAKPNGEFLGTGFSDLKENKLWYKEKVVFQEVGEYEFKIQHAMRENGNISGIENLEGILDIGLRIERITNN